MTIVLASRTSATPSASPSLPLPVSVSISASVVVCLAACGLLLLVAIMTQDASPTQHIEQEAPQTMTLETLTALAVCSTATQSAAYTCISFSSASLILRSPLCCCQSPPPTAVSGAVSRVARLPVIAVGDSITQKAQAPDGWLTLLAHWYARRVDVFNRGFSGYNSDWLLALIRQQTRSPTVDPLTRQLWTFAQRPQWKPQQADAASASASSSPPPPPPTLPISALYLLCIGANDAMLPPASVNKQHVSIAEFRQRVDGIVDLLTGGSSAASAVGVVLITPPATDPAAWAAFSERREGRAAGSLPLLREQSNTQQYAAAVLDIARRRGLPAVDLFSLTVDEQNETNRFLSDGLHLSPAGNAALFIALLSCIAEAWPQLDVSQLPMDAPYHLDISNDNVNSHFPLTE